MDHARPISWIVDTEALAIAVRSHPGASYAIDTEFVSGRTYEPVLSLIQLAWTDHILLIDPFTCDLAPLAELFATDALAILHAADADLELLERATRSRPSRLFDTQVAAGLLGMPTPALSQLTARYLDIQLDKSERMTDWTARPLSAAALDYAASDVAHLHEIYNLMVAELTAKGRLEWSATECELLRQKRFPTRHPDEAWWRVKGGTGMTIKSRCVLSTLAAARERRARDKDRIPSRVLPDATLIALARSLPRTTGALRSLPGAAKLPDPFVHQLLEAITTGLALDPSVLRLPASTQDSRGTERVVSLLSALAAQTAIDEEVALGLLATKGDITAYTLALPSRLDAGWRRTLLTDSFDELLAGRLTIGLVDGELRTHLLDPVG